MIVADRKCPDDETLHSLTVGALEESMSTMISNHLDDCEACQSRVSTLERQDPLLAALRGPFLAPRVDDGLNQFLRQAKGLVDVDQSTRKPDRTAIQPGRSIPNQIGRYKILKELGHGGMGTVYLALDEQLMKQVALKCPRLDRGADLDRFQQEARTLARLDHANICPIFDVNLTSDEPYIVLRYIDGETLDKRLKRGPVEQKQAVQWCQEIASALEMAHQQQIIHRDLKPGNIMIDTSGEIWLMDFGLSKLLSRTTQLTETGMSPGTPSYMAPEQIDTAIGKIGIPTDIYSFGVILYEMLTGQRPFRGTQHEVLAQTLRSDAEAPSKINPSVDPRLDAVCAKAMAKQPGKRYASVAEFADALQLAVSSQQPVPRGRLVVTASMIVAAMGMCAMAFLPKDSPNNGEKQTEAKNENRQPPASTNGTDKNPPSTPGSTSNAGAQPPINPGNNGSGNAGGRNEDLARQGVAFLETYCYACHANDKKYPGLDLRDRVTLLRPLDSNEKPYLVPGQPAQSRIWNVVGKHDPEQMPPGDQPQPTAAEKETFRKWIESGAEFPLPPRPKRTFIGEQSILAIIAKDLQSQQDNKRPHLRYLSLGHLWNSDVSDEHLRLVRAAVSKLINSLSSEAIITAPAVVDADGTVLRIDLRDYGWRAGKQWLEVAKAYPYGLEVSGESYQYIAGLGIDFPYLRADWFVYSASRPPLYHKLVTFPDSVGLPEKQSVLERLLAVDPVRNYENDLLQRAAFTGEASGVSDHNRMVERHRPRYGYYWPSYDFFGETNHQNLFQFPLGPKRLSQTDDNNFEHDGGELIFSLPNGLQGYMLVKADGTRIDKGPQDIVRDANQHSGSYDIVNGISCIGCHRHGMVRFTDTLRQQFIGRAGSTAEKALRLYPAAEEMSRLVEADRKRFLEKLDEAIGPFLRVGPNDKTPVESFPEPITVAARPYDRPLKLADVARELGLPSTEAHAKTTGIKTTASDLAATIKSSDRLRQLGLGPLGSQDSLTRAQLENVFGRVARELGVGIPHSAH